MSAEVFQYAGERFADIQMLRYQVPGFDELTLRQKTLIYYLSQASLLGRDILWDQNGRFNLRLRRILEAVYTHFSGDRSSADFAAFAVYMKRVWFSNGIHHHYGCEKFQPGFTQEFLHQALEQLQAGHIALGYSSLEAWNKSFSPSSSTPRSCPRGSIRQQAKTSCSPRHATTMRPASHKPKPRSSTHASRQRATSSTPSCMV